MEAWLTLPVRLIIVLLVGYFAWSVVSDSSQPIKSQLVGSVINREVDSEVNSGSTEITGNVPVGSGRGGVAILIGVSVATVLLGIWEWFRFSRFRMALDAVSKLGGSVRFDPPTDSTVTQFLFAVPTVDLSDLEISSAAVPQLSHIPRLSSLRLAGSRLDKFILVAVSRCRSLTSLDLSSTGVTDRSLNHLVGLRKLKNLLLSSNGITDAGLLELSTLPAIRKVELIDTQVTERTVTLCREAYQDLELIC